MIADCPCPLCGAQMTKVIYFGLPGRLCEACSCVTGLASYAPAVATDTDEGPQFCYLAYEGSYWPAFWAWLTGRGVE